MDFSLTEDQKTLREEIIRFAQNELSPGAAERDAEGSFSRELWKKCGEMGFQGLSIPTEYGGSGLDAVTTAIALDALGYGCEDNGLVFSIEQLDYLIKLFGVDHVLIGTDYPFDMGEYDPVEHVYQAHDLSEEDREKICGLNALGLLKRDAADFTHRVAV